MAKHSFRITLQLERPEWTIETIPLRCWHIVKGVNSQGNQEGSDIETYMIFSGFQRICFSILFPGKQNGKLEFILIPMN